MFCSSINTLAAFSKLSISGKIPFIEAANLVNNIQSASFAYLRSSTTISDTTGFGTWSFSTSNIPGNDSVTGSSNSQLWTDTTPLVYETNRPIPVAHYTFDIHKTNGNTCFDEINNSQGIISANAVITNANTYPFSSTANPIYPGYGQGYFRTNRTANSFASLTPVYTGGNGITFAFWMNVESYTNSTLFSMIDASSGVIDAANNLIDFVTLSSTALQFRYSNGGSTAQLGVNATYVDNIWRHYAITLDPVLGNSYIYQNGALLGNREDTTPKYPRQMMRKYFTLGRNIGTEATIGVYFSDFRIYNTTLSQLDVTELYYSYAVINNSILSFPMKTVSTAIYDETGLNALTLNNGATVGTSAVNTTINCISLVSASNQFINLPAFQSGAEGVTISMYFRSVSNSVGAVLLDLSGSIIVQVGTSGNLLLTVSGTQFQSVIAINNSVWNHFAITFTYNGNGSGQGLWRIYLNGAIRLTHSDATAGPTYTYFPAPQYRTNNCIGKSASADTNYFNGEIGDVRIYNRTLSAVDVTYLFYVVSKDTRQYHIPRANTLRYTLDTRDTFGTTSTETFDTARTITLPNSNMLVNETNPIGTEGYLTFANQSAVINTDISCGQTVAYSIYVKKPLSSTHDIIYSIGNTTVPIGQYVTMGTLNNILYYTFNTSTSGTTFAAGPPGWNENTSTLLPNLSTYTSGDLTLTPDEKILVFTGGNNATVPRGVFMSKYTGSIYNDFSANMFQTPVQIGDISFINLQNIAMSCSAEIIVVTQRGGYVYVSTGNGTTYTTFTQTADTTLRTYTGLGMTATGSRIACSTNEASSFGGIFIANWNSNANNYDAFTQVISNASGYNTMCMSIDGSVLAYAAGTNCRWAIWNGTTYIEQTKIFTSATAPLNMKFSLDRNVIHMTTNSTTGLQFSNISADGSYNNFTGRTDAFFPQNQNVTGLHITPNTNCYICINDTLNTIRRNVIYYGTTYRQHSFYQVPDANWHNYVLQVLTGSYRVITDGVQRTVRLYNFNSGMDQSFAARAAVFQNRLGTSLCTPLSTFTGQLSDFRISSNTLTNMEYVDLSNGAFYREYNNTQFNTYDFSLCYTFSPKIVVGTTVYDTAANVAATIVGTASAVYTRDTGGFLSLTNGYLSLPSISVGNAGTSIALWHFATNNGTVFEFADALSNTYLINCRVDTSNSLYFTVKNNTVRYETQILHNYERNRFTHLVWNMFTNGTWQIVLNGELIRTVAGVYPYQTSYALAYVGKNTNGSTGNLNGGVDDIRIYNKTLSLDYVQQQLSIKFKKYSQYFTDVSMSSGFTTQFLLGNTIANTGTSGIVGTLTGDNLPYVWYTLERDTINAGTGTSALNGTAFGTTSFDINTRIYGAGSIVSTTSSGINMPTLALNGANGLTIAFWIYRTDAGNNTYLSFNNAEMTFASSDNTFTFTYGANSVSTQITSTYTWNHIAITLTATSPVARIYINGVLANSQFGFTYPSTTFTTNSILSFNGNADDFRIYQRTLADYDIYNICKSAYTTNTLQRFSVPSTYLSSVLQQDISLSTFTTPASGFSVSYWLKHEQSVAHETVFSTTRTVSGDYLTLGVLNNKLFTTVANATVPVPTFANIDISGLVYDAAITSNRTLTAADLLITKNGNRMIFTNNWLTTGSPYINFTSSLNLQNFGNTISDYRWAPVKRIDGVLRMMHMAATADGGRLIVSQSTGGTPETGFLFLTTWNEGIGSYDPSLIKITNTPIDYQNIDMTADGNMMVFCDGTNIYLNYWNPLTNNYVQASVINQTTSGLSAFNVALTMDGSKIAYSDNNTRAVVYALWSNTLNNFDYANRVSMGNAGTESSIRNLRFSHDGRIIYASKLADSASSVYYGRVGITNMVSTGTAIRPVSQDTFGLCIDAFGYIYTVALATMPIRRTVATYASNYRHLYGYAAIPNNNWNHYTHTFATDGTLSVFINGQVVHRLTSVYPISVSRTNNFIGNDFFLSRSYFNGLISDFRIYNSVLTEANIAPIYYGTLQANGAKMLTYSGKTMDTNEINYVLTRTEIAVKPAPTTATYAVWTATAAKSIKISTTFANYDASTNGIGIQLFKINADTTFNTVLYSRTTTNVVLSNQNPTGYLSIPVIETDVVIGDKIYCRIDANGNSVASSAVLNIVISAK